MFINDNKMINDSLEFEQDVYLIEIATFSMQTTILINKKCYSSVWFFFIYWMILKISLAIYISQIHTSGWIQVG